MKILITGDLSIEEPTNLSNSFLSNEIIELFSKSDFNITHFESPLTKNTNKIHKIGPNLKVNRQNTFHALKKLNINIATLASNHISDYGEEGIKETIEFCQENHIKTVGAGMNLEEASKTLYLESSEGKIAIINFTQNEFSPASESNAGFHPMDIIDNTYKIQEARKEANYVIVIIHGGHEHYKLPSPQMQKQYRFYAEQGANIIVGHHTHCINGNEIWNGTPIYYSLGNFLSPKFNLKNKDWFTGLVLEIDIINKKINTTLHPIRFDINNQKLQLLTNNEKAEILEEINALNTIIINPDKLKSSWSEFLLNKKNTYLNFWSPYAFIRNRYTAFLLRKLNKPLINKKGIALYLNLMRCEAHREVSIEILSKYLNSVNKVKPRN